MTRRSLRAAGPALLLALLSQSCVSARPGLSGRETECERFFAAMDAAVAERGVADAGAARIEGFPELRVDRFLASFAGVALQGERYAAWVERLRRLDETARRIERSNLLPEAKARLPIPLGLTDENAPEECGKLLAERDIRSASRRSRLLERAQAPDSYSTWERVIGLYPLTRWVIVASVGRLHGELRKPFLEARAALPESPGRWLRYAPPPEENPGGEALAALMASAAANPLGLPEPSGEALDRLFASYAPVFAVETLDENDLPGAIRLGADEAAELDANAPVVYRLVSHARYRGRALLQLNYLVWFKARPPERWLDIYAGRFDGLIWRVTLAENGAPLAYDSIHPCGCYYLLFPGEGVRVAQPADGSEPILSPMPIPRSPPGARLAIRLAARTHFIQGVAWERDAMTATTYGWRAYDELRSLSAPNGGRRSLFDADGLVAASARPERFLLWPMGVPSPGAMRQWGTHAIAFLGRRHFDDPRLLETLLKPLRD
jgi:hypothetical protein